MTVYDSQTTVTIGGVDYTGKVLKGVAIDMGRENLVDQPNAGYARIEIWDDWNTAYTFEPNATVVISIWQPVTATQQPIFTGKLSQTDVATFVKGELGGIALHTIKALGTLAELNRKTFDASGQINETAGTYIADVITKAFSPTWDSMGTQYTWDSFPATLTWNDLLFGGVIGDIDDGYFQMQTNDLGTTNALELAQNLAKSSLGVLAETADGALNYYDVTFRNGQPAVTLDGDMLTPNLNSTLQTANLVNVITTVYEYNLNPFTLRDDESVASYGQLDASRNAFLEPTYVTLLAPVVPSDGLYIQADVQNEIILNARALPYQYPNVLSIQLENPNLTNAKRVSLMSVYCGMRIQASGIPDAFLPDGGMNADGVFHGFVEGWSWQLTDKQAYLSLTVTDYRENYFGLGA